MKALGGPSWFCGTPCYGVPWQVGAGLVNMLLCSPSISMNSMSLLVRLHQVDVMASSLSGSPLTCTGMTKSTLYVSGAVVGSGPGDSSRGAALGDSTRWSCST